MTTTSMTPKARAGRAAAAAAVLGAVLAACGTTPTDPTARPAPPDTSTTTAAAAPAPSTADPSAITAAQPYPTGSTGTPRGTLPVPSHVNGQDPSAIATAALSVMYAMDTRMDTSPHDATVRATRYLTPKYGAELRAEQPRSAPGAQWQDWADHHAYTTATISPADDAGRPSDSPTIAYRQYTVTVTARGDTGYSDVEQVGTAFIELTRTGSNPWRISTIQIR